MVTREYVGRPRRWATGIELVEEPVLDDAGNPVLDDENQPVMTEVNPIPEGARAMISESARSQVRTAGVCRPGRLRGVGKGAVGSDHGRLDSAEPLRRDLHQPTGECGRYACRGGVSLLLALRPVRRRSAVPGSRWAG